MDRRADTSVDPCLAPTLEALGPQPREALDRLSRLGFRSVQLSAAQPGLRPRELDRSGRRDLRSRLRRLGLAAAGLDLWIPVEHFVDPARVDRAVAAAGAAIALAGDLGQCPVCLVLPGAEGETIARTLADHALRHGVRLADHRVPPACPASSPAIGVGIDVAAWLARDEDPAAGVAQHAAELVSVRAADEAGFDAAAFRGALAFVAYRGPVVIDLRADADPWRRLAAVT